MPESFSYSLESLPFLTCIEPELVTTLCKRAAMSTHVKQGEALYRQGDISDVLFVVQKGTFKSVWVNQEGKEIILQLSGKGSFLGENSICDKTRHLTSAIAMVDSRVCILTRDNLEEVIRESPGLALQVICNLGNRLRAFSQEVLDFRIGSTRERVLKLLIKLAAEYGEPCPEGTRINMRLTQYEISCFIGASRVMVAQTLKRLIAENQVTRDKNQYILIDPEGVRGSCCSG
ncbi:MAG TPA: Crp/Fnr family transcriptional regulator [Syntrophomonas sp.]|jgi:CRP/FNR family transcriptional regulator|nr:Crp/Fnr family transcriptional regulator [Syntrophomonas sp.]